MNMKNIACLLLLLMVYACSEKGSQPNVSPQVIDCKGATFLHPSELFGSITYSVLEDGDEALFSRADKAAFEAGNLYVADFKSGKVLSFSKDGTFRFSVDRRGRGPQEYVSLTSFSVNNGNIFILDGDRRTVLCYNATDGAYIDKWEIDFEAWDLEALDNGNILFAFAPLSLVKDRKKEGCYRFILTDPKMNPITRLLPFDPLSFDILSYKHYLSTSGDKIIAAAFDMDGCHIFSRKDGSLENTYKLDLDNSIPADKRNDFNVLLSNPISYVAFAPLMGGNVIQFMVRGEDGVSPILFDAGSGRAFKNSMSDFSCFVYDVVCGSENGLVALWMDSANYDFLSQNGFPKADSAMESAVHSGKPMVVYYNVGI